METKLFCMTNSGVYLYLKEYGLMIDAPYGPGPYSCFSSFPQTLCQDMRNQSGIFAHLNGLLFTHDHGDHCDKLLLGELLKRQPQLQICKGATLEREMEQEMNFGPFHVVWIHTRHEMAPGGYQEMFDIPHAAVVLETTQERILFTADARLDREVLQRLKRFPSFDLVFCNPIQLAEQESGEFFKVLSPQRIIVYHLPAPEDDCFAYGIQARQLCAQSRKRGFVVQCVEQMHWLDGETPFWM